MVVWHFRCIMKALKAKQFGCSTKTQLRQLSYFPRTMWEHSGLKVSNLLIYNDPIGYADLVLNGNPEIYLKTVTECKPLD